jgi:hypothetical protein
MRLQKLVLYKNNIGIELDGGIIQSRLIEWLTFKPAVCPHLASVRFVGLFADCVLARAFRHFARHDGLKDLWLGTQNYMVPGAHRLAAIKYIATLQQHQRQKQRLYPQLRSLAITVAAASVAPLAQLLRQVTRLSLVVSFAFDDAGLGDSPCRIFSVLAPLRQLCALRVGVEPISRAGLRLLDDLTHLRELELPSSSCSDVCGADDAALLQALLQLHTLGLRFLDPVSQPDLLSAIGWARPELRRLALHDPVILQVSLERELPHISLFPCLETLDVPSLAYSCLGDE